MILIPGATTSWLALTWLDTQTKRLKTPWRAQPAHDWSEVQSPSFKQKKTPLRSGMVRVRTKKLGEVDLGWRLRYPHARFFDAEPTRQQKQSC